MQKILLAVLGIFLFSNHANAQPQAHNQSPGITITKKVTVTDSSGLQIAAPLIVAGIAFLSAAASLLVSSISSVKLKEREYRNDYFKKVIEKRLKGIESIQDTTAPLRLHYISKNPNGSESTYHAYFLLPDKGKEFKDAVAETSQHVIWHSQPTAQAFGAFTRKVSQVIRQCKGLNEVEARAVAIAEFKSVADIMSTLHKSIGQDMLSLHKVEDFFQSKLNTFNEPQP